MQLVGSRAVAFWVAHVFVECASDSVIPKFLRVTLDTFWRARIDLCMHGLVQPQTHLQFFEVFLSARLHDWFRSIGPTMP